ncbi:MAG: response regulator transcription factor [Bacteroidales bacterium]|nr:response regulator transcription factor [Bacteroidales bacterium]
MTTDKTKILLVEPSRIVAEGLCKILNDSGLFGTVSCIASVEHLVSYMTNVNPDVLIINPILVPADKLSDFVALRQRFPNVKNVAFCTQLADNAVMEKFSTVLNIFTNPSHVVKTLRDITEKPQPKARKTEESDDLSKREIEILILVAQGLMNKEIADQLNISLNTVITHRKNIIKKTGIKSVAGLTSYALMHNYINIGS